MRYWNLLPFRIESLAAVALLGLVVGPPALAQTAADTYTWSAQLVAVDERAGTITVQSRLVTEADAAAIAALGSRTQATLVWSGMTSASGVRKVMRGAPGPEDWLSLPVELVSFEREQRQVRFTVAAPRGDLARVRSLAPGGWVTATSPRRPSSAGEAITRLRPYSDVS